MNTQYKIAIDYFNDCTNDCIDDEVKGACLASYSLFYNAPGMLSVLKECTRLLADYDQGEGEESTTYKQACSLITEIERIIV